MRPLFPHQEEALTWATPRAQVALFMEMRLGKTAVAIRWVEQKKAWPVLVVAPLTVLAAWERELLLEGIPREEVVNFREMPKEGLGSARWCLVNYEQVRAKPVLLYLRWQAIVLDESTRIRNPQAQTTKVLTKQTEHIPNRLILSGLPAPEGSMDYFSQMQFLLGKFMGHYNFWSWRNYFFQKGYTEWDWIPARGSLERIKTAVREHAVVMTRKQVGIGSPKIYETRTVEQTPGQSKIYRKVEKEFALQMPDGSEKLTNWVIVQLRWMARIAGGYGVNERGEHIATYSEAKTNELVALLQGDLKGERVVVWFRFNCEINRVSERLGTYFSHGQITGETPPEQRKKLAQQFQAGQVQVLLCQVKCAKFGSDLSGASTAIYYSNSYDYEDRAQSEDRIIHPAKKEPLLYLDLVTKDTVDEDVVKALREKGVTAKMFMNRILENVRSRYDARRVCSGSAPVHNPGSEHEKNGNGTVGGESVSLSHPKPRVRYAKRRGA